MKVMLAQINTTPGDFENNWHRIKNAIHYGNDDPDVIVFPELTIPGYLSQDLMYHKEFVDKNIEYREKLVQLSLSVNHPYIIVGYIDHNTTGSGKPFRNMAAVIQGGKLIATYQKQLLPFYDVFDEGRYFEPGKEPCVVYMHGHKVGITICEDVWNDKGSDDYNYANNPIETYRKLGVDTIISINSSPYVEGKAWKRIQMAAKSVDRNPIKYFVYVNQIGGQDELVFDGRSFVIRAEGYTTETTLTHVSKNHLADSYETYNLKSYESGLTDNFNTNCYFNQGYAPKLRDMLVLGLRDYVYKTGFEQVVFGSSGGVDSAVVATLAVDALGAENVHAIMMPSKFSSQATESDALLLHQNLGIKQYHAPITHAHKLMLESLNTAAFASAFKSMGYNEVANENIQARIRDVYIMHFSNAFGALPLGTGNKTESAVGYYTHFDMSFGFAPLKDVYKQQIFEMAKADKRIPENIWKKPPSAELAEGQTDEDNLLPYHILDVIVRANIEDHIGTMEMFKKWLKSNNHKDGHLEDSPKTDLSIWCDQESSAQDFERIIKMIARNEYKRRQTCPGVKVTPVAFGIGRRYPIVQRFI
jgi:NAD+ synthase (glutamine-hydrolysing)